VSEKIVFVVDDEVLIAETFAIILRQHHYAAVAFSSPIAALTAANALKPDLLISDFQMPEMNGIALAAQFQSKYPDCKVLMISGAMNQLSRDEAFEAFDYIAKPVPIPTLLERVQAVLV
jgi:DNA-binding NtrC family response regulator